MCVLLFVVVHPTGWQQYEFALDAFNCYAHTRSAHIHTYMCLSSANTTASTHWLECNICFRIQLQCLDLLLTFVWRSLVLNAKFINLFVRLHVHMYAWIYAKWRICEVTWRCAIRLICRQLSVHGNPVNDFWLLVAWIFLKACSLY